jgi:hypothetical protein
MPLAALLMQPQPRTAPLLKALLDAQRADRAYPRKGIAHHSNQRAVAEPDQIARTEPAGLDGRMPPVTR